MPAFDASTRAEAVVDALGLLYRDELDPDEFMLFPEETGAVIETAGDITDWQDTFGGRDAFECLVRTILSQNTSDTASQPAHEALMERYTPAGAGASGSDDSGCKSDEDLAVSLSQANQNELAAIIEPAGLYNQKAQKIIAAAQWVLEEFGSAAAFDEYVTMEEPEHVRNTLLEIDGVGPKTADCVLLFAGGRAGIFPVDTHVFRIARRIGLAPPDSDHEGVRKSLEASVPAQKCGFGHTAMIQFGREYCTARNPVCLDDPEACPLVTVCDRVGVSEPDGTVVDPSEAATDR